MLELRFLNPHLRALNPAVGTFIGNALSVALTTWPLMPLGDLGASTPGCFRRTSRAGWSRSMPIILVLCYAIEIALLWHLLP